MSPKKSNYRVPQPGGLSFNRPSLSTWFRAVVLLLGLSVASISSGAQELNCTVKVMRDKILNVDAKVFTGLESAIASFLNTRKWTGDDYQTHERIGCNVLLNVTARGDQDPDLYTATLSFQATRPVFNSGYSSPLINTLDRDVVFRYSQFNPLVFDDNRVSGSDPLQSNLTAILAYYAYLILALDYDSYSPNGGTALLKKAQNIVANAPEEGGIKGWKAFEERRNRYWIINQLLSPRYIAYRTSWYTYHREGLDIMWNKPVEGRAKVLTVFNTLQGVLRDNQQSTLIQSFFNAKSDEAVRIIVQGQREEKVRYLGILALLDPANAAKYSNIK